MKVKNRMYIHKLLPILFCGLSMPLSMFMLIRDSDYLNISNQDNPHEISQTRWLVSIIVPVLLLRYGSKRKSVTKSGAICGALLGIILSLANYVFISCLAMLFISGTKVTKFRSEDKKKFEKDFREGGQRGWVPALCNAGMPTQLAVLYLIYCGSGEQPIDFLNLYRSSWLGIGVLSSFACCSGDIWGTEIGTFIGSSDPILITTGKKVPRGTNGGVSLIALFISFLGGLAIGVAYYLTVISTVNSLALMKSSKQWPIILVGGIAGFLGSLINIVLSATIQYTGVDENGNIVEAPGKNIKHISGYRSLDNHNINLVSSILTGIIIPPIASRCWP